MASVKNLETAQLIAVVGIGLWLAGDFADVWQFQAVSFACLAYAGLASVRWVVGRLVGGQSEPSRLRRRIRGYNRYE